MRKYLFLFTFLASCQTVDKVPVTVLEPKIEKAPEIKEHCERPSIVNSTDTWSVFDEKTLNRTYDGCRRHYDNNYCPKTFYKTKELSYYVTCEKR